MSSKLIIAPKKHTNVQHKTGNFYLIENEIYVLAIVSSGMAALIGLRGNRFSEPVAVPLNLVMVGQFANAISECDFNKIALGKGNQFEYIPTIKVDLIFD